MICPRCGKNLPDNTEQCDNCGMLFGVAPAEQTAHPGQPKPYKNLMANPRYFSLGGWLLFFVICNIIGIVVNIQSVFVAISESLEVINMKVFYFPIEVKGIMSFGLFVQFIAIIVITLMICYIVQIFKKGALFLRYFQISVLLNLAYTIPATIFTIQLSEYFPEIDISTLVVAFIAIPITFFLYTLYYCRSVRVQTYMGTDEYKMKAIFRYRDK